MIERGIIEVRDLVLWPQHIRQAPSLQSMLLGLNAGHVTFLRIEGQTGVWERMQDGKDGRPTTGLKPCDKRTRDFWHTLYQQQRNALVSIEAILDGEFTEVAPANPQALQNKRARTSAQTTEIGYTNRNGQTVIAKTEIPGNDHFQEVYVLRCAACGHEYGANGSDIFQRRCPKCDRGAPGLSF